MGRKSKRVNVVVLHNKLLKLQAEEDKEVVLAKLVNPGFRHINMYMIEENCPQVAKDLRKIRFDYENVTCNHDDPFGKREEKEDNLVGYHTLDNGFTFLGVQAGGDWERPVFFILYLDHKGVLRGYIPSDGNVFNPIFKTAYGSEGDSSLEFDEVTLIKKCKEAFPDVDPNEIDEEIKKLCADDDIFKSYECFNNWAPNCNWKKIEDDIKNRIEVV